MAKKKYRRISFKVQSGEVTLNTTVDVRAKKNLLDTYSDARAAALSNLNAVLPTATLADVAIVTCCPHGDVIWKGTDPQATDTDNN